MSTLISNIEKYRGHIIHLVEKELKERKNFLVDAKSKLDSDLICLAELKDYQDDVIFEEKVLKSLGGP